MNGNGNIEELLREMFGLPKRSMFLSARQEKYLTRKEKPRQERYSAMRHVATPQKQRLAATDQREQMRAALKDYAKMAADGQKMEQKEKDTAIKQEQTAEKQDFTERKTLAKFYEDQAKMHSDMAKNDPLNAQMHQQQAQELMQKAEQYLLPPQQQEQEQPEIPPLTEEDIALMGKAPDVIAQNEQLIEDLQERERALNYLINQPVSSLDEREKLWDELTEINHRIGVYGRENRQMKKLLGRLPEAEKMAMEEKQRLAAQGQEMLARATLARDIEKTERELEEYEKRPVETREEEAERKLREQAAGKGIAEEIEDEFAQRREQRLEERRQREEVRAIEEKYKFKLFEESLRGDREAKRELEKALREEFDRPTEKEVEWGWKEEDLQGELKEANKDLVAARRELGTEKETTWHTRAEKRVKDIQSRLNAHRSNRPKKGSWWNYKAKAMRELEERGKELPADLPDELTANLDEIRSRAKAGNEKAKQLLDHYGVSY